ncbi:hypothetical protein F4809DRAFT_635875 [Biscogniauxia mediterranea]|nr:hypothetical protein F4809DRAFT_635875 [Biscogniauxia mediterranea]
MQRALAAQAAWVAAHVPDAPAERGVALFQQVEDPRVVLETAHWASSEQHGDWLASDEYRASSAPLAEHFLLDRIEYFHLDTEAFGPAGEEEEIRLLESPVVSVGRVGVAAADKQAFAEAWDGGKSVLVDFAKPHAVRSGFRKQKADPDMEESVFFVGWPTVERHAELAKTENFAKYAGPLLSFAKSNEVKHYRRIL